MLDIFLSIKIYILLLGILEVSKDKEYGDRLLFKIKFVGLVSQFVDIKASYDFTVRDGGIQKAIMQSPNAAEPFQHSKLGRHRE